jgi:hypothetical protein
MASSSLKPLWEPWKPSGWLGDGQPRLRRRERAGLVRAPRNGGGNRSTIDNGPDRDHSVTLAEPLAPGDYTGPGTNDMALFHGLSAFPITPIDAHGIVDTDGVMRLASRLASAGVGSIGLLGSTGT